MAAFASRVRDARYRVAAVRTPQPIGVRFHLAFRSVFMALGRRGFLFSFVLLALISLSTRVPAQSAQAGPDYVFRPGDVIAISVAAHSGENIPKLTIPSDGSISIYGQTIPAAGRTRAQLEKAVRDAIATLIVDPIVSVNLVETPYNKVYVNGAVETPGAYDYTEGLTLLKLLTQAGGLKPSAGRTAFIQRGGQQTPHTVDLAALYSGDPSANVVLQPGDYVQVGEANVFVIGLVATQGPVFYRMADTVLKAVAAAGGTTGAADVRHVFVVRNGKKVATVNLLEVEEPSADPSTDATRSASFPLEPGDVISVPALADVVHVEGAVTKPGDAYVIPKQRDKVLDILAEAGGATTEADLSAVMLRRELEGGQTLTQRLDLRPNGSPSQNAIVKPGDYIYVPVRRQTDRTTALLAVSTLVSVVTAIRSLR